MQPFGVALHELLQYCSRRAVIHTGAPALPAEAAPTAGASLSSPRKLSGAPPGFVISTFVLAESWLSLARQQEAMDELLVIWSNAGSAMSSVSSPHSFYPLDVH
jgi:hypothetical protein